MKTLSITSQVETEGERNTPKDSYKFGKDIQHSQPIELIHNSHTILFNKGRYFETTISNRKLRSSIAQAIKSKVQYQSMIVASWRKLEAFVKAMNKRGVYINIDIDWI